MAGIRLVRHTTLPSMGGTTAATVLGESVARRTELLSYRQLERGNHSDASVFQDLVTGQWFKQRA